MRVAIDSSVLWSVFKGEADASAWVNLLAEARHESQLVTCDVVFAETSPLFPTLPEFEEQLERLGVEFDPIFPGTAFVAGQVFREYRSRGGPREHLIPDFLIAAHALQQADRLAARDRGYMRVYFPDLKIVAP